ncbi:MAG: efflux RND transporter permease subunit, partial [Holophagales bacterium]|nr:efflux RND transporter permease subunit [Holophagales bacterium]
DELEASLESFTRGREATRLQRVGEEVPVVLRGPRARSIEGLLAERLSVGASLVPLGAFLRPEPGELPAVRLRADRTPIARLVADLAPAIDLGEATAAIRSVLTAHLPEGLGARIGGANEAFGQALRSVGWSLAGSLVLVYLILAAQFESSSRPLVVLAVVPLALGGSAAALAMAGSSWNLMSLTGCVVMLGIAVNDAILKLDFVRQRCRHGVGLARAVREAGRARLRPMMMTTLTTSLGLLPLALGRGAGADLRAPLALSILGGLIAATFLTLILVPALLTLRLGAGSPSGSDPFGAR